MVSCEGVKRGQRTSKDCWIWGAGNAHRREGEVRRLPGLHGDELALGDDGLDHLTLGGVVLDLGPHDVPSGEVAEAVLLNEVGALGSLASAGAACGWTS